MVQLIDANSLFDKLDESSWYDNADRDIAEDLVLSAPTIDLKSLFFTVGKRANYFEKLYTEMQAVTELTPERLLELFKEGYTLQAPDYRKNLEEMQRIAWMDLPGQNGGQDR